MSSPPSSSGPPRSRDSLRSILRCLYLPWAWLVFMPGLVVVTFVAGTLAILTGYVSHRAAGMFAHMFGWMLCRLNFTWVTVSGREHVRPGVSYVFMSNHQSHFDVAAVLGHLWMDYRWVAKKELRSVPIFGKACENVGYIFVDRSDHAAAIASLDAAKAILKEGTSVFFFPEGTRSRDGRMREFKKGGFVMAMDLGLPILPISITGSRKVLPGKSFRLLPGLIRIRIHPEIDVTPYGADRDRLIAHVRKVIGSGLSPWERGEE